MDPYAKIIEKIIERQESIIGPVAIEQAAQVPGLHLDWSKRQVSVTGNKAGAVDTLVKIYQQLFGQISVEVSKEAAAPFMAQLPQNGLPVTLT